MVKACELRFIHCAKDGAVRSCAFGYPETHAFWRERRLGLPEPVVELWTGLPADDDRVLESGSGHKRNTSAFPFEESISAYRRTVADFSLSIARYVLHRSQDRRAWVFGCRGQLKDAELAVLKVNTIGERPAGIDGNSHFMGLAPILFSMVGNRE